MKPVALSERLRTVASMVTRGSRVCDVGCDHGFVSIYLVEQKASPHVLAMDVREGPLCAARKHVSERGLGAFIETRLSDGLHNYEIGEADSLICAGMGGRLMMRILGENKAKTDSFREMVLQPQSEAGRFRAWLREQGYRTTDEKMVEEGGRFYPMMRVETCGKDLSRGAYGPFPASGMPKYSNMPEEFGQEKLRKLSDRYGMLLLMSGDNTLRACLKREERIYGEILGRLREQGLDCDKRRERFAEVEILLQECRTALEIMAYNREGI